MPQPPTKEPIFVNMHLDHIGRLETVSLLLLLRACRPRLVRVTKTCFFTEPSRFPALKVSVSRGHQMADPERSRRLLGCRCPIGTRRGVLVPLFTHIRDVGLYWSLRRQYSPALVMPPKHFRKRSTDDVQPLRHRRGALQPSRRPEKGVVVQFEAPQFCAGVQLAVLLVRGIRAVTC